MSNILTFPSGEDSSVSIDLEQLLAKVRASADSTVALCGSLAAGFGTPESDFDVFVFCENRPSIGREILDGHSWVADENGWVNRLTYDQNKPLKETYDYWGDSGLALGINYSEFAEIRKTLQAFHQQYEAAISNPGYLRDFSKCVYGIGDKTMLSKLHTGKCLRNPSLFSELLSICPVEEYCYLSFRIHIAYHEDIKDLVGAWRAKRYDLAYHFAKLYMDWAAYGFSHLLLDPNTNRKWLPNMIKSWPTRYQILSNRYIEITSAERRSSTQLKDGVIDLLDLADSVFSGCSTELEKNAKFLNPEISLSYLRNNLGSNKTEYQVREEYEWYRRLYDVEFIPSRKFLEPPIF